jgi:hypothetical protein
MWVVVVGLVFEVVLVLEEHLLSTAVVGAMDVEYSTSALLQKLLSSNVVHDASAVDVGHSLLPTLMNQSPIAVVVVAHDLPLIRDVVVLPLVNPPRYDYYS